MEYPTGMDSEKKLPPRWRWRGSGAGSRDLKDYCRVWRLGREEGKEMEMVVEDIVGECKESEGERKGGGEIEGGDAGSGGGRMRGRAGKMSGRVGRGGKSLVSVCVSIDELDFKDQFACWKREIRVN